MMFSVIFMDLNCLNIRVFFYGLILLCTTSEKWKYLTFCLLLLLGGMYLCIHLQGFSISDIIECFPQFSSAIRDCVNIPESSVCVRVCMCVKVVLCLLKYLWFFLSKESHFLQNALEQRHTCEKLRGVDVLLQSQS